MKITIIRRTNATETWSVCTTDTFFEKVRRETKSKYISQLREKLPSLQGSGGHFTHIDRIPRICPVAEFERMTDGSWKFKRYNGIVLVEVNRLSGRTEAEFVKSKAARLGTGTSTGFCIPTMCRRQRKQTTDGKISASHR